MSPGGSATDVWMQPRVGSMRQPLWRPSIAEVPSIHAWYRPDELTPDIDGAGDLIVWRDQSGNGYDATATTRPAVQLSVLNGHPIVKFNGAGRLVTASIPRLHGVDATIFLVSRPNEGHGPAAIAQWGVSLERTATIHQNWNGDFFGDVGTVVAPTNRLKSASFSVVDAWELITIERWTANGWVWQNGELKIISTDLDADVPTDSQPFRISLAWDGEIAEIIVCNAVLGTALRQKIEGYLTHKFGLGIDLAAHPWRTSTP